MKKLWLAPLFLSLIAAGCQTSSTGDGPDEDSFMVTILKSSGGPLEGAVIEGGIDWEAFRAATDSAGRATLPGHAKRVKAMIHLNNYFPREVTLNWPYLYELAPTPKRLRLLGSIEGRAVRFTPGRLATVDYYGKYHLYAFDENGLVEIASADVPRTVKQAQLIGDTLWLSTHEDGVFAYSLADPEHPLEALHLDIPGNTPIFALKDSLIVVGNYNDQTSLGVYIFEPGGSFQETARFFDSYVSAIAFVDGYLIVTNYYNSHPKVYGLSNPANPVLLYDDANPAYWSGFLFGHQYIQIPQWNQIAKNSVFGWLDLTNPAIPRSAGTVVADSRLVSIVDDTTAIGYYCAMGGALSVLKGSLASGFKTAAIISEDPQYHLNEFGGCAPPYFVISNRLWVLEERTDLPILNLPPQR